MTGQTSPRLFVSHPSTKADTALHIEKVLNARGVECWIAPRDIDPGEQWDVAIHRAIAATDAMLLLFCEDSDRSKQVKRELILADQSNRAIIPMRLERIEPQALSYHLADSQWIDWIEQRDEAIDRIAAAAREFRAQRLGDDPVSPVMPSFAPGFSVPRSTSPPAPGTAYGSSGAPPAPKQHFSEISERPYAPYPGASRRQSRTWLWVGIAAAATVIVTTIIILLSTRGPAPRVLTAEFFAGTWSDSRECTQMYRFDRSGSVTDFNGQQGRWRVEEGNMLVVEGLAGSESRRLEIIGDDHVTGPDGSAYRCAGAT